MSSRPNTLVGYLIAAVILLAIGVALGVMSRRDATGEGGSGLSKSFEYDLSEIKKVDPALIGYRQTGEIALRMVQLRAVAVGPDDRIYVAGDKAVCLLEPNGSQLREIALEGEPRCLAVAADPPSAGRLYVGMKDHVEVFAADGNRLAVWETLDPKALLTSIAVGEQEVYVADAGNRVVLRYDTAGKLLGRIGRPDPARNIPGFVVPSPYFDVAMAADGLLRAANPGGHRIESYTAEGYLEQAWGKSGTAIDRFCGCCNPANFALLPDGRFVTVEKGLPRVKVYTAEGQFQCVVADTDTLAATATITEETRDEHRQPVHDVAADRRGRVLLLDPGAGKIRIFEPIKKEAS